MVGGWLTNPSLLCWDSLFLHCFSVSLLNIKKEKKLGNVPLSQCYFAGLQDDLRLAPSLFNKPQLEQNLNLMQ